MLKIFRNIAIVLILLSATYYGLANFTNFLPNGFNLFKGKMSVKDTPVLIEQIKEINQLVSAEFYGEVYADLFAAYNDLIVEYGTDLTKISNKYKYLDDYAKKKDKVELINLSILKYKSELDTLKGLISYSDSTQKIYKSYLDSLEITFKELPKGKKESIERERFDYVKNEIDNMEKRYKQASDDFSKHTKRVKESQKDLASAEKDLISAQDDVKDFISKHNLVYIGRGHISAGYHMKNIDLSDIDTSSTKKITLYLPKAELIDTVINPWYYKTDKDSLMGYEIYINRKDRFYTNDDVMLVKQKCRKNLAYSALNKGILEMANKNGISTLESFFLLLGFEEVLVKEKNLISNN